MTLLRRAGYVHDIGRIAVSAGIWGCPRPLRPDQSERVRMHPYYTHQVLDRSPFLRSLNDVATAHHETARRQRLLPRAAGPDAVGARANPRGGRHVPGQDRTPAAPRGADTAEAGAHLRAEGRRGAWTRPPWRRSSPQRGSRRPGATGVRLTPREVEILGQVALGGSMREIARALSISPKTVDGHLQRIYPKIGVSTRSGATLYAMEHGLLPAQRTRSAASRRGGELPVVAAVLGDEAWSTNPTA